MIRLWPSSPVGRRRAGVSLAGLATLLLALFAATLFQPWRERLTFQVFDAYQRLAPRAATDPAVAVVDIDEASIAALGQWPWPRGTVADLVDRLGGMGAAAIAFDMSFSEPDRTSLDQAVTRLRNMGASINLPDGGAALNSDAAFAAAIARNPVVLGVALNNETRTPPPKPRAGFAFGGSDPLSYLPHFTGSIGNIAPLTAAATGIGSFSFVPSSDNIVRTMPLVVATEEGLFPALNVEALRVAQGASSFVLRSTDASGELGGSGGAMTALKVGTLSAPTDADGRLWLHFSGMPRMPVIPAADVLDPTKAAVIEPEISGRIVLIGTSAIGLRDIVATPISRSWPGVKVHAEVIDQIINQSFLTRPDWAPGAELTVAVLASVVLIGIVALLGPVLSSLGLGLLLAAVAGLSWISFNRFGLLLDPVLPVLCLIAVFGLTAPLLIALTNREKLFVRSAFGRYLSPTLVDRLSDDPSALRLGGEARELTVLFSDIRGFTTLSERLDPTALTALLNGFLTPMTDVLLAHEATIDKYIGDAIMAFWNAPLEIEGHERKACLAALAMAEAVERMNRERGSEIRIGVGLHRGMACVGNLGSIQRFSYSAIGDTVNLASRVEGLTKQYGVSIAVTEAVRAAVSEATGEDLAFLELDRVRVVGRAAPVALFALLGDENQARQPAFYDWRLAHEAFLAAYRAGDFATATTRLAALRTRAEPGLQGLYEQYHERITNLLAKPPGPDWDGVYTAKSK
ncbi:CHASE2 domain-containing protein [Paracoccus aminophilus]|uniref:Adenylate cyclase n=1 Tax=Paracoccus aminophilus JCM 7686 TaxID=1367847 RepID=S5Y696_PARAH|nr:adenylate/guanylate cyclase domain-containing protein [Paracoccus aminophilus]AGT11165.1 adenylate cyclase [Paracoccus aminophilus JCM 7686]